MPSGQTVTDGADPGFPARPIGFELHMLANLIKREFAAQAPAQLTPIQGRIIAMLCHRTGAVFQRDIEAELHIRRSTATGILQLMEKNGLILREPVDFDARLKRLVATERAKQLLAEVDAAIRGFEQQLRQGLDEDQLAQLFMFFDILKCNLGAKPPGCDCRLASGAAAAKLKEKGRMHDKC